MKPRTLLVLAAVVVALGLFIGLYERELPSSDERQEAAKKVLAVDRDEVESLRWTRGEEQIALLATGDGEWRLTEPLEARADRTAVDALLDALTDLEKQSTLEDVDRAEAGIESPRATVRIGTADGEVVLRIGAALPVGNAMVVEVEGEPPAVAPDSLWTQLTKEPGAWRSKAIASFQRDQVERIRLAGPGPEVLLGRRGKSFWLESPVVDVADRDLTSALLTSLTGLRAERFVDEEVGRALDGGRIEVVLAEQEAPFVVELGGEVEGQEGRVLARVGDQLFETADTLGKELDRGAEEWRSRALSQLDRWQIERMKISDAAGTLTVQREDLDWLRDGEKVDFQAVSDLLEAIFDRDAETLLDGPGPEVDPLLEITLTGGEGEEEVLRLWESGEARNDNRSVGLGLTPETVAELERRVQALRGAEPVAEESSLEP